MVHSYAKHRRLLPTTLPQEPTDRQEARYAPPFTTAFCAAPEDRSHFARIFS